MYNRYAWEKAGDLCGRVSSGYIWWYKKKFMYTLIKLGL